MPLNSVCMPLCLLKSVSDNIFWYHGAVQDQCLEQHRPQDQFTLTNLHYQIHFLLNQEMSLHDQILGIIEEILV